MFDNGPQACQSFTEFQSAVSLAPSVQPQQVPQSTERRDTSGNQHQSEQLHDRLPSYYTACASSKTAPWIQNSPQQFFNKLPAYITDVATLEPAETPQGILIKRDNSKRILTFLLRAALPPAKKKLNLAEYRTRREKLLQEQQVLQETIKEEVKVKAEPTPIGKSPKRPVKSEEPEEGEVDDEDSDSPKKEYSTGRSRSPRRKTPPRNAKKRKDDDSSDSSSSPGRDRSRFRSSRSPTRSSYSSRSRSSSRRRYRSSSASSSTSSSSYSR